MNRANPETLAIICNSLVSLMGVRVDALINYMNDLFGVMLQLSQHQNSFVATQATGNDSLFSHLQNSGVFLLHWMWKNPF